MQNLRHLFGRLPTASLDSALSSQPENSIPECPVCVAHGRYLDLRHAPPACATCHDAGFVQERRPNPGYTVPRYISAPCPDCVTEDRIEDGWTRSGISDDQRWEWSFALFDLARNPSMSVALDAARRWAGDPAAKPFLVFAGDVGVGKSHLAVAAAGERINAGGRVLYRPAARWFDELRETQRPHPGDDPSPSITTVREPFETAPAFVLDDLGAHRPTEFVAEQLLLVVDARWQRALPTLVTMNDDPTAYPPRLRSRLMDARRAEVVHCTGRDQRIE